MKIFSNIHSTIMFNFVINLACHNNCTGLNQCYGPTADECCNFNDGGNCTTNCGDGRTANSTFHCVEISRLTWLQNHKDFSLMHIATCVCMYVTMQLFI